MVQELIVIYRKNHGVIWISRGLERYFSHPKNQFLACNFKEAL